VLDIGGRWGFYAEPLRRLRGCEVTVLEVEEPRFSKVSVVTYGGERIPFPDGSFDVSLLVTVLHHVKVPEAVLAEAKRVTRGAVIVVEDLYRSAIGRLWTIVRDSLYNLEFFGHPRNFRTRGSWLGCFGKLGFEVVAEKEIVTSLLGLKILNGCFVLRTTNGKEPNF
jgi:SAM-dependent methyltransferase